MGDVNRGEDIRKLGFGLMRLPQIGEGDLRRVDNDELEKMVDAFLAAGFTYFDTAPIYQGGASESAIKEALVDRYSRESFQFATKLSAWAVRSAEEARAMFQSSLMRTGAGYFDFFLLHNMGEGRTKKFEDFGVWEFLAEKKEQKLIRRLGFSWHDKAEELEKVIKAHRDQVEFVQLQINWADWENPIIESRKCYEVARAYDLPIVVMEPIKGGSLMRLPAEVTAPLSDCHPDWSLATWALRFAASLPGVITVLSGMSDYEQMRSNISGMMNFEPFNDEELLAIDVAQRALTRIPIIPCTDCRYCLRGCPQGVAIPQALASLNILKMYGDKQRAHENYAWNTSRHEASRCIECGACEDVCPQHIAVTTYLKEAVEQFED
jgi:uncharacterized protein